MIWYMHWLQLRLSAIPFALLLLMSFYIFNQEAPGNLSPTLSEVGLRKEFIDTVFEVCALMTFFVAVCFGGSGLRSRYAGRNADGNVLTLSLPVSREKIVLTRLLLVGIIAWLACAAVLVLDHPSLGVNILEAGRYLSDGEIYRMLAGCLMLTAAIVVLLLLLSILLHPLLYWLAWFALLIFTVGTVADRMAVLIANQSLSWFTTGLVAICIIGLLGLALKTAKEVDY